jgi:protein-S-isoprenylcysteine O-methyltransferase Ste14
MLFLKSAVATTVVPGTACFIVPCGILSAGYIPLNPQLGILQIAAIFIAILGGFMVIWVSIACVRQGMGTPIPIDPPIRLVFTGLYRYVRNPMYVGALLIVVAEAVYFGSPWLILYAVGLWAVLHTALIIFEEPQLKRCFGADYEQYLKEVPRWIPKVSSR